MAPRYAWRCRDCGDQVACDPKIWPALEHAHRFGHRLEREIREMARVLRAIAPGVVGPGPGPLTLLSTEEEGK